MDGQEGVRVSRLDERPRGPGPCAKVVAAVFGSLFLIILLSVPVTTTTSRTRQDQGSNLIVRTSYPQKGTMFLPAYLAARSRAGEGKIVRARTTEWVVPLAIVLALGVFDYFVFCRLLRGKRPPVQEPESEPEGTDTVAGSLYTLGR